MVGMDNKSKKYEHDYFDQILSQFGAIWQRLKPGETKEFIS